MSVFFLGSWEMNRSAEQTNRVNCDLFSRFMGNESQCGTNKSHENRFLKKITFSIYTCIYISFTCCWVRLNLITSKTKKWRGHTWVCAHTSGQNKCSNFAKYLIIFCSLKCKIVNNKKNWLASLANNIIIFRV